MTQFDFNHQRIKETRDYEPPRPDMTVLELQRRPAPKLPLDIFGEHWSQWILDNAEGSACPADYVASALLSSASAMIGHARWPQVTNSWAEPPHLWCCNVGYSGDGKSPGADPLFRHVLPRMQQRMTLDFPDRLAEFQAANEVAKAREENWRSELRAALKTGKTPPSKPAFAELDEPLEPRLVLNDVTVERVALLLATAAPKGLLMARVEIAGWLLGMNAYNEGARAFWIEAYGGRSYVLDRVKHPKPIKILRHAVAWHGSIQPPRLAEVMREADDGLLARFVWFWPDPVRFDLRDTGVRIDWAIAAFDRLRILELNHEAGEPQPIAVPFSAEAKLRMVRFGQLMQEQANSTTGLLRSAIGKVRGLALRLSLVLAHLRWCAKDGFDAPPSEITEADFVAAAKFVTHYGMAMAERVFGDCERARADLDAVTLAHWIKNTHPKEVHVRTLQREVRLSGLAKAANIHAACEVLVDADWLLERTGETGFQQRRREAYPVNPRLWEALG